MNWMPIAMTSAQSALIKYSRESDGPTDSICDCERSTRPMEFSAPQIFAVSFPKAFCVEIV